MEVDNGIIEEFRNLTKENVEFGKKCAKLAQEISSGQLTIVHLVQQLGPFLVHLSPNDRELGTWILTQVLENLPTNHFDQQQLQFICAFYADRLKDHHQVIPAVLAGIFALSKFDQFPEGAATQILNALFHNVSCQQQQEQDRRTIYKIFEALLNRSATELCTMGLDFVYGVISAVDGERNPKNLVLLFNWFPKLLTTISLGHLTEDAFEVLACYFPVDFKAPANDSTAITREELANLLAPCLTAIPQFAEFCFPLALEKLESSLEIAKLDSLKLLEIGCSSFDVASYVQHITEVWSQIQKELFNSRSMVIENACLSTLASVVRKISTDPAINVTVKDICDTVKGNLLPDSKLFHQSSKILLSVATASMVSSDLVLKEIAPILINIYDLSTAVTHKALILQTVVKFFETHVKFHNQIEFDELKKVPILCLKASLDDNNDLKKTAFAGLSHISKFLSNDVRFTLYDNLQKLLLVPHTEDVRNSILFCFNELAKNYSSEIKDKLVNNLDIEDGQILEAYLSALCVIVAQDFFIETVINILLHYLQKKLDLGHVVTSSLTHLVQRYEDKEKIQKILLEKNIVSVLVDWSLCNEDNLELKCLENVATTLKTIIGKEEAEKQREILVKELPKIELVKPKRVFLLDGILSHLRRDVEIDYKILNELTYLATTENGLVKNTAAQLLGNLLNKCNNENVLHDYLAQFNDGKTDLTLMAWITKALVMRNHVLANQWTDTMIKLLESDANVATCFRIVINDNFDCLSPKSFCVRSILYQQKFFTIVSNKMSENYRPEFNSFLLAIGYLLQNAPKQVILLQFKKILKLIILSLDECEESEVLIVMLQIIKDFIANSEKCIEDNLSDFLTRFLKLSTFDKSMKVRILALQCLQECTSSFPIYKLLLHKQEVLQILGKTIDDKKRIVRRQAVEARSLWFILDAPM